MFDPLVSSRQARLLYARIFQPFTQQFDLTQPEIDILLFLYNKPACNTARDIAHMRGLAKSNVSTALESLRQKGFLRVENDPHSRRLRRLFLSEEKMPVLRTLHRCQRAYLEQLICGFSKEETETLARLLERMAGNISDRLRQLEETGAPVPEEDL